MVVGCIATSIVGDRLILVRYTIEDTMMNRMAHDLSVHISLNTSQNISTYHLSINTWKIVNHNIKTDPNWLVIQSRKIQQMQPQHWFRNLVESQNEDQ